MTSIKRTTEKNLMVFSGRAHPELAQEVASLLDISLVPTTAYEFANSEIYVRFQESVRGSDAFVIQSHTAPVNEWIMEHLIMVDALKRASAKRITVVMPFYGYARQDKKHRGREPISARLMADLFKTAGADRLIAVDLHTAQIQGFFDGPVDHLMALPILSEYVKKKYAHLDMAQELAIVSPDAGRIKVAEQWSARLGGAPLAFIHKTRDIHRPNESVANRVVDGTELDREEYRRNDRDRCYHCKTDLYERLAATARVAGGWTVLSGANADDLGDWRPGLVAAAEHGVRHPLVEAGMGKARIRAVAVLLGLPSAAKPASPCLASRVPYGTAVSAPVLAQVDRAEAALHALGWTVLRVRHHGDRGRVQLAGDELGRLERPGERDAVVAAVRSAGYREVEIDPHPFRSGSLNLEITPA